MRLNSAEPCGDVAGSVTVRPLADVTLARVWAEFVRHIVDSGHDHRGLRDFAVEVVRLCLTR